MKYLFLFYFLLISSDFFSQSNNYNLQKGFVAQGYDVVAYFKHNAVKGNQKFTYTYNQVSFLFSSKENLELFTKKPKKYIPQYGGYCAYAIATTGKKVAINPKTFEIREGKLYLFYNAWGNNTLQSWKKESPKKLQKQASLNWRKFIKEK